MNMILDLGAPKLRLHNLLPKTTHIVSKALGEFPKHSKTDKKWNPRENY